MPQIAEEDLPAFLAWLESKGVSSRLDRMPVGELKATQREINSDKVEAMRGKVRATRPIVVSTDGYVLDGHHRWAALLVEDPLHQISVIRVALPIKVLLKVALEFPKSYSKDIRDTKVANATNITALTVKWRYLLSL
jgi:hypothetical protein